MMGPPFPFRSRAILTVEDAPGSKTDPVEARQTTENFDEFIAVLTDASIDPDSEEMTRVFQERGLQGGGCGRTFLRRDARSGDVTPCVQFVHRGRV